MRHVGVAPAIAVMCLAPSIAVQLHVLRSNTAQHRSLLTATRSEPPLSRQTAQFCINYHR